MLGQLGRWAARCQRAVEDGYDGVNAGLLRAIRLRLNPSGAWQENRQRRQCSERAVVSQSPISIIAANDER
ncbi:hypothetical protein IMCC26134_06785 [Verrucomicrobia bacterium IMCC26134]|nr:hypothetical protein IMCC26134_06785 [Verrucomicrobia bacterium IMCC26134]